MKLRRVNAFVRGVYLKLQIMALAVHGFYGRGGSRHAPLPTANADVLEQVEKLTEAVTDLQKAQEYNAVAIESVVQKVEDIVKSADVIISHRTHNLKLLR